MAATLRELRANPARAEEVGRRLFPPDEAALIEVLVRRDAPFYSAAISPESVASLNAFARSTGLLSGDAPYEQVVARQFAHLWVEE